ncbi:MAG: helix-turn-helix domain-containing protein [Opitutales bacterium]
MRKEAGNTNRGEQLYLFSDVEIIPRGDGTYVAKPTAPKQWLTTAEAAKRVRVDQSTVRNWAREGWVTARRCGPKLYHIEAGSLYAFAAEPNNHLK